MEAWDTIIGVYTADDEDGNTGDTICLECGQEEGRTDIGGYIIREGNPDGFTCIECGYVIPCDPDRCTCETTEEEN